MGENPGPTTDAAMLRRSMPLSLASFDPRRLSSTEQAEIASGVAVAKATLVVRADQGPTVNGWMYPRVNLGPLYEDYRYRAQTAINGFAAPPTEEAIYLFGSGPKVDLVYECAQRWRLTIPGDRLPPNDTFWSLVVYRATEDGQFLLLLDNPINRYSIGDRTPGLRRVPDGSITIALQGDPALEQSKVNWLPPPMTNRSGSFWRLSPQTIGLGPKTLVFRPMVTLVLMLAAGCNRRRPRLRCAPGEPFWPISPFVGSLPFLSGRTTSLPARSQFAAKGVVASKSAFPARRR